MKLDFISLNTEHGFQTANDFVQYVYGVQTPLLHGHVLFFKLVTDNLILNKMSAITATVNNRTLILFHPYIPSLYYIYLVYIISIIAHIYFGSM